MFRSQIAGLLFHFLPLTAACGSIDRTKARTRAKISACEGENVNEKKTREILTFIACLCARRDGDSAHGGGTNAAGLCARNDLSACINESLAHFVSRIWHKLKTS